MVNWLPAKWWAKPRLRTILIKGPLWVVGGLLIFVLLAAALFSLPVTRVFILQQGLKIADKSLPGKLVLGDVSWPQLGRLKFEDVRWVGDEPGSGQVWADLELLDLHLDLPALRQKDVRFDYLTINLNSADVPAIMAALNLQVEADSSQVYPRQPTDSPAFPRPGCIPGVPSLALHEGLITARALILPEGLVLSDLTLELEAEAGYGQTPRGVIHHLAGYCAVTPPDTAIAPFGIGLAHGGLQVHWLADSQTMVLDSLSVVVSEAGSDLLRQSWRKAGPVYLASQGHLSWQDDSLAGNLDCTFTLPGGAHLNPLIPVGVSKGLKELVQPPLLGQLNLRGRWQDDFLTGHLDLDLADTMWLERGLIKLDVACPADFQVAQLVAHIDTLDVALLGFQLQAKADIADEVVRWRIGLDLTEATLPQLLGGQEMENTDLKFQLHTTGEGPRSNPQFEVDFAGEFASPVATVSHFTGNVSGNPAAMAAVIRVDGAYLAEGAVVDSLKVDWRGDLSHPDSLAGSFAVAAWAQDLMVKTNGQAQLAACREVRLDSLIIAAAGLQMCTHRPTTFTMGPVAPSFTWQGFALEGEPGSVAMGGKWDDSGLNFHSKIDLFFPEEMLQRLIPDPLWSSSGGVDVAVAGGFELQGLPEGPQFDGALNVRAIPHRDDPVTSIDLAFFMTDENSGGNGLGAEFSLASGDSILLHGTARAPGQVIQGKWQPVVDEAITLEIPEQDFQLARLNRFLPEDVSILGRLNLAAGAGIIVADTTGQSGKLSGLVRTSDMRITLPNRSRLEVDLDLGLSGPVADPLLGGKITIQSGFFRIPEMQRTLHPTEGTSLLWAAAQPDSLDTGDGELAPWHQAANAQSQLQKEPPLILPQLDLQVHIPGNLRLYGYGLAVELGGDLAIKRGADADGIPMPVMTGVVEVLSGTMKFMNRVFTTEKGNIRFAGQAPADPMLDLELISEVGAYLVRIQVSGVVSDPVIELISEPEMNEVDIMAVLFFGQPTNDLNNEQRGHMNQENDPGQQLRENLAGLAVVFGTAGIQDTMTNTLGVDMMEIGSDSSGDSTIMVGKFLTPQVMLKYHQSLAKSGSYFFTLEYSLSRFFKLISSYGQGDEPSGMELGFSRRY